MFTNSALGSGHGSGKCIVSVAVVIDEEEGTWTLKLHDD